MSSAVPGVDLLEGVDAATSVSVITTLPAEPRPADQATYTVSAIDPSSVRHGKHFAGTVRESRRYVTRANSRTYNRIVTKERKFANERGQIMMLVIKTNAVHGWENWVYACLEGISVGDQVHESIRK